MDGGRGGGWGQHGWGTGRGVVVVSMESTRLSSMCAGRHAVAREKGRRGARFAGTARRRAGPARDFDRTIHRKGRDIAARANVRGIDAGQTPSRRRLSAPPKGRHSFARVVVRDWETHHSRLDAPALRLAGVCAFMFGSSARSLRQVLPPENIMSYRVSIGLLRRRLLLRPDAHLSANKVQSAANNNRRRLCGILRIELRHF